MKKSDARKLCTYLRHRHQHFEVRFFVRKGNWGHEVCMQRGDYSRSEFFRLDLSPSNLSLGEDNAGIQVGEGGHLDSGLMLHTFQTNLAGIYLGYSVRAGVGLVMESDVVQSCPDWNYGQFFGPEFQAGYVFSLDTFVRHLSPLSAYFTADTPFDTTPNRPWWDILRTSLEGRRHIGMCANHAEGGVFDLYKTPCTRVDSNKVVVRHYDVTFCSGKKGTPGKLGPHVIFEVFSEDMSYSQAKSGEGRDSKLWVALDDPDFESKFRNLFTEVCRSYLES
jgi:hypothetical protein